MVRYSEDGTRLGFITVQEDLPLRTNDPQLFADQEEISVFAGEAVAMKNIFAVLILNSIPCMRLGK